MRNKLYNKESIATNHCCLRDCLTDWLFDAADRSTRSADDLDARQRGRSAAGTNWQEDHVDDQRHVSWHSQRVHWSHDARTDTHRENEVWNSDHDTRPPEGYLRRLGKYELSVRVKYTNVNNDNNINTIVMKHVLYGMQNRHSHRSVIFYWCSKQSDKLKTIPLIITQWILPIKLTAPSILNSSNITIFLIIRTLISGLCSTTSLCSFFSSCNCSLTMHSLHLWK